MLVLYNMKWAVVSTFGDMVSRGGIDMDSV